MKRHQVGLLLLKAQALDGREQPDDADVAAWHELVYDVPYALAVEALQAHFRESPRRLMPSDICGYAEHADEQARMAGRPGVLEVVAPPPGVAVRELVAPPDSLASPGEVGL